MCVPSHYLPDVAAASDVRDTWGTWGRRRMDFESMATVYNATVNSGANRWRLLDGEDIREIMGILAVLKFRQDCGEFFPPRGAV